MSESSQIKPEAGTSPTDFGLEDRKESIKTYVEQTKLLVALASAFVFAPAVLTSAIKGEVTRAVSDEQFWTFVAAEVLFVLSIMTGYVVLGTIAGSQVRGEHWVYRRETVLSSFVQIGTYVVGLTVFIVFSYLLMTAPATLPAQDLRPPVGSIGPSPKL
ncbi:hypothetical protein HFN68_32585 [Rhizobium laguerreae]|uniref:hypothetical protein n=1 Tax=Rhizobium laguerreae TaxID=1076926 RepID=UPI001C90427C|nr:hypothetical protein [Rhizobium laguerreae]MBY3537583.1 hypothetical protein [Rhizobium laguerreae]